MIDETPSGAPRFADGDQLAPRSVTESEVVHRGLVWDVVRDTVDLGESGTVRREYVSHPGAVCVLALDEQDRALFVRQYRHPVQHDLWELPAGLLDVPGEPPVGAAQRELAEEADLTATRWDVLVDWFNSPGGLDETIRLFLARDLSPVALHDRFEREHEERDMVTEWVALDVALDAVLQGRVHNASAVVGVLAACAARDKGWSTLRPVDTPWPEHKAYR